jgi:hypothetical protein
MSIEGTTPEEEAIIAKRILEWFDLLIDIRKAASVGVDANELVKVLLQAHPPALDGARVWLELFLFERFMHEAKAMKRLENLAHDEKFTLEQYETARTSARTRKELASLLGVSAEGLRLWEIRKGVRH